MCVGCRRRAAPSHLVRVVGGPGGSLLIGRGLPGRGAWICADAPGCVQKAAKRNAFAKALRVPVAPAAVLALWPSPDP